VELVAAYLSAEELLAEFPSNELSRAVARAGLPAGGSKLTRVGLLVDAGRRARAGASRILALFRTEALRRVCTRFGIRAAGKDGMILALSSLLGSAAQNLALEETALVAPTVAKVAGYLSELVLPWRLIRDEGEAEAGIARALRKRFRMVSRQYSVGGHLGYRIDVALGNGRVGVEVKLARALVGSSSETYRALGQAIVYKNRKFANRLVIAIVGPDHAAAEPALAEVCALLDAIGAVVTYVRLR
jgi:hypothetical protein